MSEAIKLYRRIKKQKRVKDIFPLMFLSDETTVVCRDGSLVSVIKVVGKDYDGMSEANYDAEYRVRKQAFEFKSDYVSVDVVSMKKKVAVNAALDVGDDPISEGINVLWQRQFDEVYRTYHYLVLTTHQGGLMEKIGQKIDNSFRQSPKEALENTISTLMTKLDSYTPELLENDDIKSFFASLVNGRDTRVSGKTFNDTIANQYLHFPKDKEYCSYGRGKEKRYSAWLSIQNYPKEPGIKTIERVFSLPIEVNVYQSFKGYSDTRARRLFKDKGGHLEKFAASAGALLDDLNELAKRYAKDEFAMVDQYFCIEIMADSEQELEVNTRKVRNAIEQNDATCYRESVNIEALFWSRFPTLQHYNLRKRPITTENAAHFATLSSIGEGYDTCRFGARPVTLFKTVENSQFSFTWHDEPSLKGEPLGHTAFIGDTGVGKTTLFTFLVQQCLSFDGFKAVLFDRLQGMEVFTEMFNGDFIDFNEGGKMNPFKIDDTAANRSFLMHWIAERLGVTPQDSAHQRIIKGAVDENFKLDFKDRGFESLAILFGAEGSELREKLNLWLPDGAYGGHFNADRNVFNFDKKITTLDFTNLLQLPELLKPTTSFLFHQIENAISNSSQPHLLGFDEAQQYFQDKQFAQLMLNALKMVRKKLGVVALLFQNAEKLQNMPDGVGSQVIGALANVVIYPDPSATKEAYCDFLGLTDTEFKWIKETNPKARQVLFKRLKSGESVKLNADLSCINGRHFNYLNAFASGGAAVNELHRLKSIDDNWRSKMLAK